MALENNFYQEINNKEQKWIELIENNLLNIYYFEAELDPFYIKKLEELTYEYNLTNSKFIGLVKEEVSAILLKLEELENAYRAGKEINIKSLIPLFLTNKFINNVVKEDNNDLKNLKIRKEVLQSIKSGIKKENIQDDYLYDDFPEEQEKTI